MGRYYNGDIEGKFAFGSQASNCCDRFGVEGVERVLYYEFEEDNLADVEAEIKKIEEALGDKLQLIKDWIETDPSYVQLSDLGVGFDEADLSEYYDMEIGIEIRDCIQTTGQCYFEAEL
jgi:hypothetical protein